MKSLGILVYALPLLAGCTAALPRAGSGSSATAKPTAGFPVAYSGERFVPAAPPPTAVAAAPTPAAPATPEPKAAEPGARKLLTGSPQRTAYALVIGIEKYRDLPPAPAARSDANAFAEVLKTSLAIPSENIRVATDDRATSADLTRHLAWLQASVPAGGRAYIFYSGHGSPETTDGTPYLVPYDADPNSITTTAVPLSRVTQALEKSKAKESFAFVDACFSGSGGQSVLPAGARPLVRVREVQTPGTVTLFASASGNEIAGPTKDGTQGAFSRYLVDALGTTQADLDGDGQVTLKEMAEWVTPRVSREASLSQRAQTPRLIVGPGVGDPKSVAVVWGLK